MSMESLRQSEESVAREDAAAMGQQFPYGYCPTCGAPGVTRERRPGGDDTCSGNPSHTYPSASAAEQPNKPEAPQPGTKFQAFGTVGKSDALGLPILAIEGAISVREAFTGTKSPLSKLPVGQIVKIEITV